MSMTIAGVLPTLTAPLTASVAALSAKETMFSGKLGAAQTAYQNADDSGQQSVGQLAGMLGQVGQMGQAAGSPAQSLGRPCRRPRVAEARKERACKAAAAASRPWARVQPARALHSSSRAKKPIPSRTGHANRMTATPGSTRAETSVPPLAEAAGPDDRSHSADPAPVAPPDPRLGGDDDLARRM
jgi:hypothetical protein